MIKSGVPSYSLARDLYEGDDMLSVLVSIAKEMLRVASEMGMIAKLEEFATVEGASFCGLFYLLYFDHFIIGKQLMSQLQKLGFTSNAVKSGSRKEA